MKKLFTSNLWILLFFAFLSIQKAYCQTIWLNELNYDTPGQDTSEFIEIAGVAGTLLDNYSVVFVNGLDAEAYLTLPLKGTLPNEKNGLGTLNFGFTNKIQNGAPDGVALVKEGKEVIQFLSYEGSISNWILDGKAYSSQELPVSDGNEAPDVSLQAGSNVLSPSDWTLGKPSPSKLNAGQADLVLSLGQPTSFDDLLPLDSEEVEIFSIQGQKTGRDGMVSGHVYLLRWKQGELIRTQKILFDR